MPVNTSIFLDRPDPNPTAFPTYWQGLGGFFTRIRSGATRTISVRMPGRAQPNQVETQMLTKRPL